MFLNASTKIINLMERFVEGKVTCLFVLVLTCSSLLVPVQLRPAAGGRDFELIQCSFFVVTTFCTLIFFPPPHFVFIPGPSSCYFGQLNQGLASQESSSHSGCQQLAVKRNICNSIAALFWDLSCQVDSFY